MQNTNAQNNKECYNCKFFIPHYIKSKDCKFLKIDKGHCTKNIKRNHKKECAFFDCKNFETEKKQTEEDLANKLNYIIKLLNETLEFLKFD